MPKLNAEELNILVTGGCGFIGSHTVDLLCSIGYKVIVADINLPKYKNNNAKYYQVDISTQETENIFKENNIGIIIHLAAQISVCVSNKFPLEDAKNNIIGSINIIELAKKYKVKKIIAASSAALYGNPQYFPIDEKHPTSYLSPYAISKHAMEEYIKISGIDYLIYRFSNVYGPRQDSKGEAGVISIFTDKMLDNLPVEINGTGEQTRDFIFVEDIVKAILIGIKSNVHNEIINVSSNTECTIKQLFKIIKRIIAYNYLPKQTPKRVGDIFRSVLDNRKAEKLLQFKPQTELEEGLSKTIIFFSKEKYINA
jgi:UDP-glucose 4-epimerase